MPGAFPSKMMADQDVRIAVLTEALVRWHEMVCTNGKDWDGCPDCQAMVR
jgi:hypothetical protein